jgi:hypothetical protein
MDNVISFNNLQERYNTEANRRESKAIFTMASNVVFSLYSCRFQRHTIIDTTAIAHTMKQADAR